MNAHFYLIFQKKWYGLLAILALLGGNFQKVFSQSVIHQGSKSPNFVVILTDDLGYGDVGVYGATDIETPNLDRLAADGLKLTSFYTSSPVCSPSRFGLLTGRYPKRAGIHHVFFPESFTGIPKQEVTLAEALRTKGYATGIVGKWHLGHHQQFLPLQHGFDEYYGIPYSNDMLGVAYLRGNDPDSLKVDQRFITRTYTHEAVTFIQKNKNHPFFLYLAHSMPHLPLYVSSAFEGKSKRGLYGDVIEEIDWSVGEVVKALKENGLTNNTIVIFTSDNGPWKIFDIEGGSAGPLRNGKGTTFEGGIRVPGIISWPGKIKPGSVYDDLVLQLDLYPTFTTLAGVDSKFSSNTLDGEDISPVLFGKTHRKGDEFIYYSNGKIEGFRKGDWKIRFPHDAEKYQGFNDVEATDTLLFNLKTDIGENINLLAGNQKKANELIQALEKAKQRIGTTPSALVQSSPADNSHLKKFMARHPEIKK